MSKTRVLTGITTTGTPHLGNYVGAIRPAIAASQDSSLESFFFLADLHALIKCHDPERVARSRQEIAATWIALGLNTDNATFYRQSDVPEISELSWILTCLCSKGLMNRAHAYKAALDANRDAGKEDLDDGVTMGLYSYPILMAADILMFNGQQIPVGKDQIQHIEMARDVAGRFNHTYRELFTLPEAMVEEEPLTIPGLDGRKMSKSYDNTIPLFCTADQLRKLINQIVTDSRQPGEPKDPDSSTLFELYSLFARPEETAAYRQRFLDGIAWGDAKTELFETLNAYLEQPRQRYNELMDDLGSLERELQKGGERARAYAAPLLQQVKQAVGISALDATASFGGETKQKKEASAEQIARAEAGRRRAIMMQVQPLLDQVAAAADKTVAAAEVVVAKEAEIAGLKKKAKQKAENELQVLREELAPYL
ncbi:tryptophan--tRNA ligase [Motiliproteus sediminis]|uniref:tryptophan--tRNA ligase n=1 Tax=Motiliproteus sediminis TaxID=1468178 RepID=UPI001AEFABB3|nr:tryptophan--tRNA ligase [Motiliproteus sediminis]